MKGSYVVLQIRLDSIRNFLEHVKNDAEAEIRTVFTRHEAAEFEELDDFDNALYHPIARQEIAASAVYYELNALIEHELQMSAHLPWLESDKHRGPKGLDLNNLTVKAVESLKMIGDVLLSDNGLVRKPRILSKPEPTYSGAPESSDWNCRTLGFVHGNRRGL